MTNDTIPIEGKPQVAIAVPDGTQAGQVVPIGPDGLMVVTITPKATADMVTAGKAPQGLEAGQASAYLLGCCGVLTLPIANAVAANAAVYRAGDGSYTATNTNNTKIGYALAALAASGSVDVAILG